MPKKKKSPSNIPSELLRYTWMRMERESLIIERPYKLKILEEKAMSEQY